MAKFYILILIVVLSTLWLYALNFFAPDLNEDKNFQLKFPSSFEEVQKIADGLKAYSNDHWWYVLVLFGSAYIYKQAFCIPGSLFLNLTAGVLYGRFGGFILASSLTAIGASLCYFLSLTFAKELVITYFYERFTNFEKKVKENKNNLFYFMIFIRIVPITPGWVINIIAPLVGVPPSVFFISTFIGLGPYNFYGVTAGGTLSTLKTIDDIFSWNLVFGIAVTVLFLYFNYYVKKKKLNLEKIRN